MYGEDVLVALRVVWAVLGAPCEKRLKAALPDTLSALERHAELTVEPSVRVALLAMSAATMDRRLAGDRRRWQLKGRTGTKPGTLLKHQIPIRTFADWDDTTPGFAQADLVAHDGGNGCGDYARTLTLTDVATGWTECRGLPNPNKARVWVVEAIDDVRTVLPFPLLGLDSDNGSEFTNHHLLTYCTDRQIAFTRGRPYRKNDSCHVEEKNWSIVRHAVGYLRYDTPASPYRRLLAAGVLTRAQAKQLTAVYLSLNPAQLRRAIAACQQQLLTLARRSA